MKTRILLAALFASVAFGSRAGVRITNLDQFERKKVDGKTLITRTGSNERISGTLVKLSTD